MQIISAVSKYICSTYDGLSGDGIYVFAATYDQTFRCWTLLFNDEAIDAISIPGTFTGLSFISFGSLWNMRRKKY
ncbi:MAG: hypothetical protein R2794_13685 [Chitinophagales bacterium]